MTATAGIQRSPPRSPVQAWLLAFALLFSGLVIAQQLGPKIIVTADQVAAAASASPLSAAFKQYAADIGKLAINVESGGNLGIYNGSCCTGVLQMTESNLDYYCDCTKEQYASMSLQQQVNFWAELTNDNGKSSVVRGLMAMGAFGGRAVDGAMVLSCIQIGPGNCAKTIRAGTCDTRAGADGNGNNFCDFADKIRKDGSPAPPPHPAPDPYDGGATVAPHVWTPLSVPAAFFAGAGVDMDSVRQAVLEIVCVAALLWTAWVAQASFFSWRSGKIRLMTLESNVTAAVVLTSLLVFLILA